MRETAAVFLASLIFLGWGAAAPAIATAYVDPVARIQAQDEALYAASSLQMARHGDWMTPRFLGRYGLYKPPVLYWLSAISIKLVGFRPLAVRVPSMLAGAGTVAIVFAWVRFAMPLAAAVTAALLVLSNHLFFILSRIGLTDALLVFEITFAMWIFSRDPKLESARSRWIFGAATGAAIMTKAVAGLPPILILVCSGVSLARLAQVSSIALGIALPWHLWQLYIHPRWFWAEYVLSEHLTWGLAAPQQTTNESQIGFYAKRLLMLDPVLLAGTVFAALRFFTPALPDGAGLQSLNFMTNPTSPARKGGGPSALVRGPLDSRGRKAGVQIGPFLQSAGRPAVISLTWFVVVLASVGVWQYRNAAYLAPLIPAMAIATGLAIPKLKRKIVLAAAIAIVAAKMALSGQPFGIPFKPEFVNASYAALDAYAARHRGNDLIIIEPDDQFYAVNLELARVRYLWLDPATNRTRTPLDFEHLGITVTASDFRRLEELRPTYAQRLREWNHDSAEPVASVILARTQEEIRDLIASHPETDFYTPETTSPVHDRWQPAGVRVFLLSRMVIQGP